MLSYWRSVFWASLKASVNTYFGSLGAWAKSAVIEVSGVVLLYYWLKNKALAVEEWTLAIAYGLPIVVLFLATFVWNILAIPVRREVSLIARIKELEPDLPVLTARQDIILRNCKIVSPSDEHWLDNNNGAPSIDGTIIGLDYNIWRSQISHLHTNGWVQIVHEDRVAIKMSFMLETKLFNTLKARGYATSAA